MKKTAYIAGSFLLGVMVAASAGTVSAKVKSLIGQKVTGEVSVVVNGNRLVDKGAVIDGKTTVPIRPLADALEADFKYKGSTIYIESEQPVKDASNKYSDMTNREHLEESKRQLENRISYLINEKKNFSELIEISEKRKASATDQKLKRLEVEIKDLKDSIQTRLEPELEKCLLEWGQVQSVMSKLEKGK